MGIEIDLAILKEGEEVNKHLLCGICFMILDDPIQCVSNLLNYKHSLRVKAVFAKSAWTSGRLGNSSVQIGVKAT